MNKGNSKAKPVENTENAATFCPNVIQVPGANFFRAKFYARRSKTRSSRNLAIWATCAKAS